EPLQIVEEEHQRVFLLSEHGEEAAQDGDYAAFCLSRRQFRHQRLRPDEDLQLGNEVYDETAVCTHRVPDGLTPQRDVRVAVDEELAHQRLQGLCQRRVGNIPSVLVALDRDEERLRRLLQLVYHRRLTDAGEAGDEHHLGHAARRYALQRGEQHTDFLV